MSNRTDMEVIVNLLPEKAKVLDVGCGEGELMVLMRQRKNIDARGLEIDQTKVTACMQKGLSVMQGDADIDLAHYPSAAFDFAVLTNTLQVTKHPDKILGEMLRISTNIIVTIPNFGYWQNRLQILLGGHMPVTKKLSYEWYETPNIHFCTIKDFVVLCEKLGIKIQKRLGITASGKVLEFGGYGPYANLFCEQGIFHLSK
jgi:methionine biosynthesis protein MetW